MVDLVVIWVWEAWVACRIWMGKAMMNPKAKAVTQALQDRTQINR